MDQSDSYPISRRRSLRLPRRRWHILGAIGLLALSSMALALFISNPEPQTDPFVMGDVKLPNIQQPLASTNLNSDFDALPDLLAGDVAEGANPTDFRTAQPKTDALGNAIRTAETPTIQAQETRSPITSPASPGPKTILIDGQSINGGTTELLAELTKQGPFGPLPQKSTYGKTAFKAYKRAAGPQAGKQPVSIIIGGLGINASLTEDAITLLPADVTLSFAAQSSGLQGWLNKAREDGHEVMIEIPMESDAFNPSDPSANRTLRTNNISANKRHLDWLLSRAQGYFGVINYNGDKFLTRTDASADALNRFSDSGLAFISDGAFSTPSLRALAQSVNLPYKRGFGIIDPAPNKTLIEIELDRLAASAKAGANPVGIGFAYPETLEALAEWIETLPNESLHLTPASASIGK